MHFTSELNNVSLIQQLTRMRSDVVKGLTLPHAHGLLTLIAIFSLDQFV